MEAWRARGDAVTLDTFLVAAQDQAKAMAMPDIPLVVIPHLKAGETAEDFSQRAQAAFAEIVRHLELGRPAPPGRGGRLM